MSTNVTPDKFDEKSYSIRHISTDATFFTEPGTSVIMDMSCATAGTVLPNGDEYHKDEVKNAVSNLLLKSQSE
jgi:hypothetical protein